MLALRVDQKRLDDLHESEAVGDSISSGIFVRAQYPNGVFGNADIVVLDRDSLLEWLRKFGDKPSYAESVVLAMLGHEQDVVIAVTV